MIRRLTPRWRLRASLAAVVLPPLVHLASLQRIAGWIEARPAPAAPDATVDDAALAEWVDRVLTRLPPPWRRTCLKRALVLHYLLHRAGRPATLVIGVRRDEHDALAAHAWLAHAGTPYLESGADQVASYQVLTAFPSSTRGPS
ncbi:MAG TPA: lasso peptide biosynthesis B2 protein [Gemmatimonadales bacterium]|nr:lasso peptide biosynthesis B2 protein [Gemmatimonadales bacterium]